MKWNIKDYFDKHPNLSLVLKIIPVPILFIVGFGWVRYSNVQAIKDTKNERAYFMKRLSQTIDPNLFFANLGKNWFKLTLKSDINWSTMAVTKSTSGKFILTINAGHIDDEHYEDLGEAAKVQSIAYVDTIVKICSNKLYQVEKIALNLNNDNELVRNASAEYEVEFHPDTLFVKAIHGDTETNLKNMIEHKLIEIKNTASGKHIIQVPLK